MNQDCRLVSRAPYLHGKTAAACKWNLTIEYSIEKVKGQYQCLLLALLPQTRRPKWPQLFHHILSLSQLLYRNNEYCHNGTAHPTIHRLLRLLSSKMLWPRYKEEGILKGAPQEDIPPIRYRSTSEHRQTAFQCYHRLKIRRSQIEVEMSENR